ncbi:Triple functional domain protein, partial [Geodia barretti]
MLENSGELFQHLQVSQVTSDLGGTIRFNHQEWIDTQRVVEKHLIQLLNRLDGYEHVRGQLEQQEKPSSLIESRDSVRRHVDAQDIIAKEDLDCECEAVSHAIAQLRPCSNPDFNACFGRLEEMCSCLLSMQVQLQRMWDEKGAKLDQVVQLRKYEHDSAQMMQWIETTAQSLSDDHTDIGDSLSSAEINKQAFHNFQSQISSQYQEISRVITT